MIADKQAAKHGYVRVIDESGEDYGFSAERFFILDVPEALAKALGTIANRKGQRSNRALQPTAASRRRLNT
jgi:hypothetical protein